MILKVVETLLFLGLLLTFILIHYYKNIFQDDKYFLSLGVLIQIIIASIVAMQILQFLMTIAYDIHQLYKNRSVIPLYEERPMDTVEAEL